MVDLYRVGMPIETVTLQNHTVGHRSDFGAWRRIQIAPAVETSFVTIFSELPRTGFVGFACRFWKRIKQPIAYHTALVPGRVRVGAGDVAAGQRLAVLAWLVTGRIWRER